MYWKSWSQSVTMYCRVKEILGESTQGQIWETFCKKGHMDRIKDE